MNTEKEYYIVSGDNEVILFQDGSSQECRRFIARYTKAGNWGGYNTIATYYSYDYLSGDYSNPIDFIEKERV